MLYRQGRVNIRILLIKEEDIYSYMPTNNSRQSKITALENEKNLTES